MPAAAVHIRADHATRFTSQRSLAIWEEITPEERKAKARYARSKVVHLARAKPTADFFAIVDALGPSPTESRAMLADLAAVIGAKRAAAILSLTPQHFSQLSLANSDGFPTLRKHVWLVWCLLLRPGSIANCKDLLTAGRFTESAGPQHAGDAARHAAPQPRVRGRPASTASRSPDASQGKPEGKTAQ